MNENRIILKAKRRLQRGEGNNVAMDPSPLHQSSGLPSLFPTSVPANVAMDLDTAINSEHVNDAELPLKLPSIDSVYSRHNEVESCLSSITLQGVVKESSSKDVDEPSNSELKNDVNRSLDIPSRDNICLAFDVESSTSFTTNQNFATERSSRDIEESTNLEIENDAQLPLDLDWVIPSRDNLSSIHSEVESFLSSSTLQGVVTESSSKDINEPSNSELKNDVDPSLNIPPRDIISLEVDMELSTSFPTPQNSRDFEESTNPELDNDAELPLEYVVMESKSEEFVATPNSEPGNDVDTFLENPSSHTTFEKHIVDSSLSSTNVSKNTIVKWFRETEYSAEVKRLGNSVYEWMKFHMSKGGNYDFSPVIDDYNKHLDFLKKKYPTRIVTTTLNTETGIFTTDNGELFTFGEKFVPPR